MKKYARCVFHHIAGQSLSSRILCKFGVRGHLTDVITCVKFLVNRFRGYGVLTLPKLLFPTDLLRRPYNSVGLRTAVRHCDLPRSRHYRRRLNDVVRLVCIGYVYVVLASV